MFLCERVSAVHCSTLTVIMSACAFFSDDDEERLKLYAFLASALGRKLYYVGSNGVYDRPHMHSDQPQMPSHSSSPPAAVPSATSALPFSEQSASAHERAFKRQKTGAS